MICMGIRLGLWWSRLVGKVMVRGRGGLTDRGRVRVRVGGSLRVRFTVRFLVRALIETTSETLDWGY